MRPPARHALPLLLTAALSASGCAVSTPHTSRQLGHGDMVFALGADLPGAAFIPNMRLQLQSGVGDIGDVTAHVGLIPLPLVGIPARVGLGFRGYPARWLTLSADGDLLGVLGSGQAPLLTATWRATSTTNDARRLYGGLHLVTGWTLDGEGFGGGNLGLVGGWESRPDRTGNTIQVELSLAPLAMNQDRQWSLISSERDLGTTEQGAPFVAQLSFSYHMMYAAERPAPPSPPPSKADD